MKTIKILTLAIISCALFSCTDDDDASPSTPISPNEEELITTVRLNFMDAGGGTTSFDFNDPDGDGGNAPVIDTITLGQHQPDVKDGTCAPGETDVEVDFPLQFN